MTTDFENPFANINYDEGDDNPWGLDPGIHVVEVSNAEIERSSKGNLGLWVTFSDEGGKSIRRWVTLPEKTQDEATRKRNTTFLKMFLNNLEVPQDKWNKIEPDDLIGIPAVITVKPQKDNDEYNQITKIRRRPADSGHGMDEFRSPGGPPPEDGGFSYDSGDGKSF